VTDRGLVHLKGMARLRSLNLRETRVTDAWVKDLKRSLPNLKVYR
jgi:hypothetical protein